MTPAHREQQLDVRKKAELQNELEQRRLAFRRLQTTVEHEIHQYWKPHRGQVPVARALLRKFKRYVFMQCGRKFGKTEFAIYCMYMFAILFPNSQIYFIADTMKHAGELVWENGRLPRFFLTGKRMPGESEADYNHRREVGKSLHNKYVLKANNSEMRITFRNGSFIKVDGAENYANADGIEPSFLVYDEFKSHDPRYNEAMEPNLKVHKAPLLIIGTPPEDLETYYEKIANSVKRMAKGAFFKRPSFLNPIMYPLGHKDPDFKEEYDKYAARDDLDVFEREYMAEIVRSGSKAIFPMLEMPEYDYETEKYIGHSKHVRPHSELVLQIKQRPKDWEYFAIYDAGTVTCFATLIAAVHKYDRRVVLLDEIYATEQGKTVTSYVYPLSVKKMNDIYDFQPYWTKEYDYAAAWFAAEVLDRYEETINPCTKDLKDKENKLGLIKDTLIHGKLLISEKCVKMLWEMNNYRKDDKGKIPKENDHLMDCLRYLFNAANYTADDIKKVPAIEPPRSSTIEGDIRRIQMDTTNLPPQIEGPYAD